MTVTVDNAAHRDHAQAAACRALWSAVLLTVYNDYWTEAEDFVAGRRPNGRAKPRSLDDIRADALRYFRSRDGKMVTALAGITADPERMANVAVDLDARERTKKLVSPGADE